MILKKAVRGVLAIIVALAMISPVPALAKDGKGTAKAAIVAGTAAVILGSLLLADKDGGSVRYAEGPRNNQRFLIREYDRGYHDGRRGYQRHNYNDTRSYLEGYREGRQDRRWR